MIMHANALGSGMNQLVANANTDQIQQLFGMNFNREGNAFNTKDSDLYNLTRVQPAPYWSTNHLVMKLRKDQGQPMQFVRGTSGRPTSGSCLAERPNSRITAWWLRLRPPRQVAYI